VHHAHAWHLFIRGEQARISRAHLEVLGELLSSSVARVHCEEQAKLWVEGHVVSVHEDEVLLSQELSLKNDLDLLGSNLRNKKNEENVAMRTVSYNKVNE
jgi:hypothetical protein